MISGFYDLINFSKILKRRENPVRNELQWDTDSYFGNQISLVVRIIYRGSLPRAKIAPKGCQDLRRGCYEALAILESASLRGDRFSPSGLKSISLLFSPLIWANNSRAIPAREGKRGGGEGRREGGREIKVAKEEDMALSPACLQRWPNLLLRNQFFPQFSGSKLSNLIQLPSTP